MTTVFKIFTSIFSGGLKGHFGQYAEDVIVRKLFFKVTSGRYLDIGAYHPFKFSNTAFFWLRGWTGINIDANPKSIELFRRHRKHDTNIWAAIIPESQKTAGVENVNLHLPISNNENIEISAMGTADSSKIHDNTKYLNVRVPAMSVNEILKKYEVTELDLLNIDIEGYDELIIKDFDFNLCIPKTIIIEDFSKDFNTLVKSDITTYLESKEYKLIGRVGWSSVFSFRGQSY